MKIVYVQNLHAERAAEKQASRDRDAEDLRTGRRTVEQVNADNSLAHGLTHLFRPRRELGVK